MRLYGNTMETDAGRTATLGSVEWGSPEHGDDGAAMVFLTGFGHIELSKTEAERLAGELNEVLENW